MERKLCIRGCSSSPITVLTYQPVRREVVTGHEDGGLRSWELDSGKQASVTHHHKGWITDLLYWTDGKILFSSSIDYTVIQWSSSGTPFHTIDFVSPVYSLLWNPRKEGLFCGRDGFINMLVPSGKISSNGLPLLSKKDIRVDGHTGIVKCLASSGSKVYSAGYDNKLIVYEASSMPGNRGSPLRALCTQHNAHDAGITCLIVAKDSHSSTWLATGSFDKKCKLWTGDGKLMFQFHCIDSVTGVCFVPNTEVLWVAAGGSINYYDPKSGDCITEVVPVMNERANYDKNRVVQLLKFFPDICEVIGSTNLKEVIRWCYTPSCSVCMYPSPEAHIETITYTNKRPILIFTGSYNGLVTRWERQQLNLFMYSTEQLSYKDQLSSHLTSDEAEWNLVESVFGSGPHQAIDGCDAAKVREVNQKLKEKARKALLEVDYRGFVCSLFVEQLDYLVCSCLDGKIFVWGYDKNTVAVLRELQTKANGSNSTVDNGHRAGTDTSMMNPSTSVTDDLINRVAGFTCLHVLNGHIGCNSGLELVEQNNHYYLVSAGWDGVVCVWDLVIGKLLVKVQDIKSNSDDIITCLAYSPKTDCVAYSMSDSVVYIRKFSCRQVEMKIVGTLSGHSKEVTQVRWNSFTEKWVTASEDGTIRIWGCAGGGDYEQILSVGDPISVLTIDKTYGFILAAVHNVIRVYNTELELLQVCRGHVDTVRVITHVPENDQYLTAGWDKTLRIWPAYHPRSLTTARPTSLTTTD